MPAPDLARIITVSAAVSVPLAAYLSEFAPAGPTAAVGPVFAISVWAGLVALMALMAIVLQAALRVSERLNHASRARQLRREAAWCRKWSSMKLAMK